MRPFVTAALALAATAAAAAPISQKSGAWWGDLATPTNNQVWMQADFVQPDATVAGTISFPITCTLPQPTTLKLSGITIQVDGNNIVGQNLYGTSAAAYLGRARTVLVDTTKFLDGWHELRARCYAAETAAGPALGHETQVTNGHQLYFKNGNAVIDSHAVTPGILDSHAWYDKDAATGDTINYVYVQLMNGKQLVAAPLTGIVGVTGRVSNAGATTIDHWVVKVDGQAVVELHGTQQLRTYDLDTRMFTNGAHELAMHGHGVARSGKQLAAEVRVPIVIAN